MRRGLQHPVRSAAASDDETLTVGELTRRVKSLLETGIAGVSVEGEISGIKTSPSGHVYFALKDSSALVDAVIWRGAAVKIRNMPRDGEQVVARGRLTVYEPRGRYQLVVTSFQGAGRGDLWRKFEDLKEKLAAEGLFAPERKSPVPDAPATVGVVTSPGGAALQDILTIARRRAPGLRIVISPCLVQGKDAAADIAAAIARLDRWGGADVMIVGRGGGSIEDLWAFNEEAVARAIAGAKTPVISAVGHETDFSIADFAADARAATPSEAAERVTPDRAALIGRVEHAARSLARSLTAKTRELGQRLAAQTRTRAYRKPREMLMSRWQMLDEAFSDLGSAVTKGLARAETRRQLAEIRLEGLSPFSVLTRGYAVATGANGKPLIDAGTVKNGDAVSVVLRRGSLLAEVTEVRRDVDA